MVEQLRVHMNWNTEFIRERRLWNTKTLILRASSAPCDSAVIEDHLCTIQLAAEREPQKAERVKLECGKPASKIASRIEVSKDGITSKVRATLAPTDAIPASSSASAPAPASIEGMLRRLLAKTVNVERDIQEMKYTIHDQGRRLEAIERDDGFEIDDEGGNTDVELDPLSKKVKH